MMVSFREKNEQWTNDLGRSKKWKTNEIYFINNEKKNWKKGAFKNDEQTK